MCGQPTVGLETNVQPPTDEEIVNLLRTVLDQCVSLLISRLSYYG